MITPKQRAAGSVPSPTSSIDSNRILGFPLLPSAFTNPKTAKTTLGYHGEIVYVATAGHHAIGRCWIKRRNSDEKYHNSNADRPIKGCNSIGLF